MCDSVVNQSIRRETSFDANSFFGPLLLRGARAAYLFKLLHDTLQRPVHLTRQLRFEPHRYAPRRASTPSRPAAPVSAGAFFFECSIFLEVPLRINEMVLNQGLQLTFKEDISLGQRSHVTDTAWRDVDPGPRRGVAVVSG